MIHIPYYWLYFIFILLVLFNFNYRAFIARDMYVGGTWGRGVRQYDSTSYSYNPNLCTVPKMCFSGTDTVQYPMATSSYT